MAAGTTHYQTLGVEAGATAEEIRRAYRALAKQHHPDTGVKGSEKRFAAIASAYEVLSEPSKRREYDAMLERERAERGGGGGRGPHYSWENIASGKRGERTEISEFDDLYDTFYGRHDRGSG